jgi:hypothetical protein
MSNDFNKILFHLDIIESSRTHQKLLDDVNKKCFDRFDRDLLNLMLLISNFYKQMNG